MAKATGNLNSAAVDDIRKANLLTDYITIVNGLDKGCLDELELPIPSTGADHLPATAQAIHVHLVVIDAGKPSATDGILPNIIKLIANLFTEPICRFYKANPQQRHLPQDWISAAKVAYQKDSSLTEVVSINNIEKKQSQIL